MIPFLLLPGFFLSLLIGIFAVFTLIVFSFLRQEKKASRQISENTEKYITRINELQAALAKNQEDYKQQLTKLEDSLKSKDQYVRKNTSFVQEQLITLEQLRADVAGLQAQLSEKEVFLKREIAAKDALEKRLKEELFLNKQMYDGLKDQYTDLEASMERLVERLEQENAAPKEQKEESVQPTSN